MWKTGVTSVSFRQHTPQQIIAAAAAAGLDGIEWGADVHVPAGDLATAEQVRQLTQAAGLEVLSYGGYYRLGTSDRQELEALLASAAVLGVKDVRIWGGSKNSGDCTPEEWQALVAAAQQAALLAQERGMTLSLECHNLTVTDDWQAAQRFLQQVDSSALRMYWQPNQLKSEEYDLAAARALAPCVTNVHVFSWLEDRRLPLNAYNERWEKYFTALESGLSEQRDHAFILEFMPDDQLETLPKEAKVLNDWLLHRGRRPRPQSDCLPLLPYPRTLRRRGEDLPFAADGVLQLDDGALYTAVRPALRRRLKALTVTVGYCPAPTVRLQADAALPTEGYRLSVQADAAGMAAVTVAYAAPVGAFYALQTLEQLLTAGQGRLPQVEVEDAPDYPVRGYMLDVGRNRIPLRSELFSLVDKLAGWKINHLQLYMEGVPYAYPHYPEMWRGRELLTAEDILALDAYCKERFIELVPAQNNFGHMDVWLKERFRSLAECPDGFEFQGTKIPDPRCLNPFDPASLQLVNTLADDLLPCFSSEKYNICCDETLELGQGASKAACEADGMEAVYVDFVTKVCEVARTHGRRPMIWDDIIRHDPKQLQRLPKDVILLDWGYSAEEPIEANLQRLQQLGCTWYVCPGTGAWNCYLGSTDKMLANISRSARLGLQYGAVGLLNTDWGDAGHLQSISSGYAGIAYGAAMAWGVSQNEYLPLAHVLDVQLFEDAAGLMGDVALDAGRYNRYEGRSVGNVTQSMWLLFQQDPEAVRTVDAESFARVRSYLADIRARLERTRMQCAEAPRILAEYRWAIRLVDTIQLVGQAFQAQQRSEAERERALWQQLALEVPALEQEGRRVWQARSRQGWLEESMQQFRRLAQRAAERLSALSAEAQ